MAKVAKSGYERYPAVAITNIRESVWFSAVVTSSVLFVVILAATRAEGFPTSTSQVASTDVALKLKALKYLKQFGYINTPGQFPGNESDSEGAGHRKKNESIRVKSNLPDGDENEVDLPSDDTIIAAVKKFQKNFGLDVTGKLDETVEKEMDQSRCGVKDTADDGIARNSGGYFYLGGRPRAWRKRHLTYRIDVYSRKLPEAIVDREIRRAFGAWSDVTDLTFEQVPRGRRADIEVRFGAFAHSDYNWDPWFDGPGGTLAHAFGPDNGDAHFDESEPWVILDKFDSARNGVDLYQVAVHEFGHSLGLGHSRDRKAIMFATYQRNKRQLMPDDIRGIQSLYGLKSKRETPADVDPDADDGEAGNDNNKPSSVKPRFTTTSQRPSTIKPVRSTTRSRPAGNPTAVPDLCLNSTIDAMVSAADGGLYVFKGEYYWSMMDIPVASNRRRRRRQPLLPPPMAGPRLISHDWDGMSGPVDAAFTHVTVTFGIPIAATFFFKGDKCWRFTAEGGLTRGYPKAISAVFPGIPNNIDAALQHGPRGNMFFFKGDQYWKFEPSKPVPVDTLTYPRSIAANWHGLESRVDAAFQLSSGRSFFFKDDKYYEYDVLTNQVMPGYPGSTKADWFGCSNR